MSRSGRRLFLAAAIGQLIVAGLHTIGHFQPMPDQPDAQAALAAMRGFSVDLGLGMRPNLEDVQLSLSLTMTVLLLGAAVQNLLVWRAADAALLPAFALINTVLSAGLAVIYGYYQIPPPLICLGVVALLFAVSWLRLRTT